MMVLKLFIRRENAQAWRTPRRFLFADVFAFGYFPNSARSTTVASESGTASTLLFTENYPGALYEYYEGSWGSLPNFNALLPFLLDFLPFAPLQRFIDTQDEGDIGDGKNRNKQSEQDFAGGQATPHGSIEHPVVILILRVIFQPQYR